MTYEEKAFEYCKECPCNFECAWYKMKRYANCIDGQNFMSGWEAGQIDTLEEIEKLRKSIGDSEGFHYSFFMGVLKLIEQLKKEQL